MSLFHSPRVVTDGLVFYYDMSNTQKSWKGAPTTNLVNPAWAAWGIDGSGQGSIGTRTITSIYECLISDTAANTRQSIYITGISASTTYTFSVQYKKQFGAPTLRFQLQSYNGGTYLGSVFPTTVQLGLTDKEGWQTAYFSYTTAAGTTQVLWFMQDGDDYTTYTHSFILANPQCEQQSFATPFVAGTRSTTQAIVALIGNNTITANSLTYASDGTFSFNGSSNHIVVSNGMNALIGTSSVTFSAWIYRTSAPNYWSGIIANKVNVSDGICLLVNPDSKIFWQYDGGTSGVYAIYGGATLATNTWCNIVGVYDNVGLKTYLNGVFNDSASDAGKSISSAGNMDITIGAQDTGPGGPFPGKIAQCLVYNRALTATEIVQNFNAHRSRYGI